VAALLYSSARTSRWMADALASSWEKEDLVARLQAANAELREHKTRLELVVAERTRSLSEAVAQLRDGLQEKEWQRRHAADSDANRLNLLQTINEGFGHLDAEDRFVYANPAAETIFQVAPGTLAGRLLGDFLDAEC